MFIDSKSLSRDEVFKLCKENNIPWPSNGLARIYFMKLANAAYALGVDRTISDECKLHQEIQSW